MPIEKRKGGIAFRVEEMFERKGHMIPEKELLKLAESINFTKFVKTKLADEWLHRNGIAK